MNQYKLLSSSDLTFQITKVKLLTKTSANNLI